MKRGEPVLDETVEAETPARPGFKRNFQHSYLPVKSDDATITGVIGVVQDITERKRAEAELRKSEERYELAARATFNAIWDWDFVTDVVRWNEGVQSLFGYAPDAIGPDAIWWKERIHPEDRDRVVQGIHAVIDRLTTLMSKGIIQLMFSPVVPCLLNITFHVFGLE